MNRIESTLVAGLILCMTGGCASTVEHEPYTVVSRDAGFEIRDYPPSIVAETVVDGPLEEAGNRAFGRLFGYISGKNRAGGKIAMTAPVSQRPSSEQIPMTAPVGQRPAEGGWAVSFVMPASYTMETLPAPESPEVKLRPLPACRMAAVRYSGVWSEERFLRYKGELESWMANGGLTIVGPAVWARYNAPFTPWFLRRNEVLIPVGKEE